MNLDELFDKFEENPIKSLLLFWLVGGIISLVCVALAVLLVVAILNGFGAI